MERKELTKTFMMISNWKKPFGPHGLKINISASYVLEDTHLSYPSSHIAVCVTHMSGTYNNFLYWDVIILVNTHV